MFENHTVKKSIKEDEILFHLLPQAVRFDWKRYHSSAFNMSCCGGSAFLKAFGDSADSLIIFASIYHLNIQMALEIAWILTYKLR